jgi:hypothetical protein
MKKLTLILWILAYFLKAQAQIVFCPSGAEWHYVLFPGADSYPNYPNESIKYTHDTVVGGAAAKVLRHTRFFGNNTEPNTITLIKQNGDTVFMRNAKTQHSWQVLYNFNASVNESWSNTLTVTSPSITTVTYTTTVDSIKQETVNGFILKRMFVKSMNTTHNTVRRLTITERFGSSIFLFDFYRNSSFSINYFLDFGEFRSFLCYQDSVFGLKQFTNKPCDYSNISGVVNTGVFKNKIEVFPNPARDVLNLETDHTEELAISLMDIYGKEVHKEKITKKGLIAVSDLRAGIYILRFYKDNGMIHTCKIIID